MAAAAGAFRNRWWVVVGAVLGIVCSNGPIVVFSFGVFFKPIAAEFGWDRRTVSAALMASLIISAVLTPVVGKLVDRYGIRPVAFLAVIFFSLAMAGVSLTTASPAVLILLYAVLGIAGAAQAPLPYVKSVAAWFDDRRGLALGIAMAGVGIGAALVPQLSQVLIDRVGWRFTYVGLGLFAFILAMPAVALFIREPQSSLPLATAATALPGVSPGEARQTSQFWLMTSAFFLVSLAMAGISVHTVPLLTDHGISPQIAASTGAAAGLSLIVGRIVAGYVLDKIFASYVAAFFFLCPLAGIIVLGTGWSGAWPFVGAGLVGLGIGAEVDLIAFMAARYFGIRSFGEIYGYIFCAFSLGAAAGPFVMAMSFDVTGSYRLAMIGFGVAILLGTALILRTGSYRFPAHQGPMVKPAGSDGSPAVV
jgi:MFS family permease